MNAVTEAVFSGIDENMELDESDRNELMRFETVQTAASKKDGLSTDIPTP